MKILALGGCGQEGKTTVKDLIAQENVEQIIIGDINIDAANQFATDLNSNKVITAEVNVTDRPRLLELMNRVDVVANFVGPYYRFGKLILEAAITAGKDYVDICDDHDATSDLLELNNRARQSGITAIIGLGVSPGITNLAAKHGADRLDKVTDIAVNWIVTITDVEDIGASAAVDHALHIIDGTVPQYINGEWQQINGASGQEIFEFPVVGKTLNFYVGHPEPVTLPRYIDVSGNVICKGGCPGADEFLLAAKTLGLTSPDLIEVQGQHIAPRAIASQLMDRMDVEDELMLPPPFSGFIVSVHGTKSGLPQSYRYEISGRMSPWTGTPPAVAALMLGEGRIKSKGVFAPEGCLDPVTFFAEMEKRGLLIKYS